MSGVINFLRNSTAIVGKLFYFGGEGLDESTFELHNHYFDCSKPDVQPYSCGECDLSAQYGDGSFVMGEGDDVYSISEVEAAILKYYNELAPSNWDQSEFRPYRWKTISNPSSKTKYKTVKMLLDNDGDVWYLLVELKEPIVDNSFTFREIINKLQKHFKDD